MKGFIALALTMALAATGCAQRSTRVATQASPRPNTTASRVSTVQRDAEEWRRYISNLPIGTKLTLDLADGARVAGNIVSVEQDAVIMQPRTRLPSPAKRVPFDLIVAIVPDSSGGVDTGKAIAIGAAAGAVSFVAFFLIIWGLGD